jgi:hypothetical protein
VRSPQPIKELSSRRIEGNNLNKRKQLFRAIQPLLSAQDLDASRRLTHKLNSATQDFDSGDDGCGDIGVGPCDACNNMRIVLM